MAKSAVRYVCQSCGAVHGKWVGRCEACGAWNTIAEEAAPEASPQGKALAKGRVLDFVPLSGQGEPTPRRATGIGELDRVTGGGLVAGSVLLVGGDPGIGKSTLLLQAAARLALSGASCVYVSGEEAVDQVRLRARRLGLADAP
jgi:DNA repair protein RadA/Sms